MALYRLNERVRLEPPYIMAQMLYSRALLYGDRLLDRFVINHAIRSYGIERSALRPLSGGNYNTVYEFTRNGRQ